MATNWHYTQHGQQYGPVSSSELKNLAATGELQPEDLIWREGMAKWSPARKGKGLFSDTSPPPPPRVQPPCPEIPVRIVEEPNQPKNSGLIVSGYVCGALSLLIFPPALGLAGVTCGIFNLVKGQTGHGIAQIIISVTCGLFGMLLGAAMTYI